MGVYSETIILSVSGSHTEGHIVWIQRLNIYQKKKKWNRFYCKYNEGCGGKRDGGMAIEDIRQRMAKGLTG